MLNLLLFTFIPFTRLRRMNWQAAMESNLLSTSFGDSPRFPPADGLSLGKMSGPEAVQLLYNVVEIG